MVLLVVVYMLIGAQIGGRIFYWSTEGKGDISSQFFCLGVVVLLWPLFLILAVLPRTAFFHKMIWRWYET